ncbi:rRNA methyltransferase 3, mitochondrial [Xylocopa sonorina]|uniref:rRNA methyltransferase 3, mitochondrial n=1 Tax=Xylocopa sonorina TaxID=1818115 RepID=UPI00403AE1D6
MVLLNTLRGTVRLLRNVNTSQTVNLNITQTFAKWVSRRPVRIVNEDELYECEDTTRAQIPQRTRISKRRVRNAKPTKETEIESTKTNTTNKKEFATLQENDRIITSLMTELRSRKKRQKNKEVILEGHRLITDALEAGLIPTTILFNNPLDIEAFDFPKEVTLYKVPYKTIQLWSSLTTSPGLLGIFQTPDVRNNTPAANALPLTIICDNVREPGNLGSIMRAAAGVGCEKLILMKGCVDLWDPKVLRSAAGTHFRLPIYTFPTWDEIPSLISEDSNVFIADSNFGDEFMQIYSPEVLQSSLEIFDINPEDLKSKIMLNSYKTEENAESTMPTNRKMMKQFMLKFPIMPYYSLNYTNKESVIILTGETEGLSFDSCQFLCERKAIRINIPLIEGVDSLNTGVALGIVTFEIKRQFLKKQAKL